MRRSAAETLGIIRKSGMRIFRTGDIALLTGLSAAAAVKSLSRLAAQGLVTRIRRGLWASQLTGDIHPYEIVPHLTAPWPSYVSLHSVLSDAGVVEEVPHVVYAVTSGRPAVYDTPLGRIHVHHLPSRHLFGYSMKIAGHAAYPAADREKAFLDLAYLALSPRSPLAAPRKRGRKWRLDSEKLRAYAKRFNHPALSRYLREQGLATAAKTQ